jgi:DNA (cytosine-5)-methyltransferase 1
MPVEGTKSPGEFLHIGATAGSTPAETRVSKQGGRPKILDLFCGAGGASMGYYRAGFAVVGVDLHDQPRYPFTFVRGDVFEILGSPWFDVQAFDAIHASPPCQHYSDLAYRNGNADEHPDLIARVRDALTARQVPYVIENVEGSPLINTVLICGTERNLGVGEYRLRRHRLFETNWPFYPAHPSVNGCRCSDDARLVIDVSGGGPTHAPRLDGGGGRTYKGTVAEKRKAMGIDWMTGAELVEAIPPAYTLRVAEPLMLYIATQRALVETAA